MLTSRLLCVFVVWQCSSQLVHCSHDWTDWGSWFDDPAHTDHLQSGEGDEGTYEEVAAEEGRLMTQSSMCGPSATDPVGECVQYGKCIMGGGTANMAGSCPGLFSGTCCRYVAGCNAIINSRVVFWQSPGYPTDTTGSTSCVVQVKPRPDTCFVRVQFLDTSLTASTVDTCDGNTLTIDNMAEGDSSLICGALDSYETLIRIRKTPLKFNVNLLENIRLNMRIRDNTYRYSIKITQVSCAQINGVSGGVSQRSLVASGRSLEWEALDNVIEGSNQGNNFLLNSKKLSNFMERLETTTERNETEKVQPVLKKNRPSSRGRISGLFTSEAQRRGWSSRQQAGAAVFEQIGEIGVPQTQFQNLKTMIKAFVSGPSPFSGGELAFDDVCSIISPVPSPSPSPEPELPISTQVRVGINPDGPEGGPAPIDLASVTDEAPYFGTVMALNDVGDYSFCGATLIAPTYVLTAASCLLRQGFDSGRYDVRSFFDDSSTNILPAAVPRTWDDLWARPYSYTAKRVVFHPMYDHNNFHYDIAVIELDSAVDADLTPIALPTAGTTFENTEVTLIGHGVGDFEFIVPALRPFWYSDAALLYTATTMTTDACRNRYGGAPNYHTRYDQNLIEDEMLCVEATDGPFNYQACEGDQGGPVVANFGTNNPVLVGIISGNQHNCIDSDTFFFDGLFVGENEPQFGEYPDITVRITSVLDFINAATTNIEYVTTDKAGGLWNILFTLLSN